MEIIENNSNICSPSGVRGRRFGQTILLKPEGAEAYVKYHAEAWPGVLTTMVGHCKTIDATHRNTQYR
jgi:hypothetical protein